MQARIEHEFSAEDNLAMVRLSEELSRFSLMAGAVGFALVGLGVAAIVTSGYESGLAGPSSILLGLVALIGGVLFLRPRVSLNWITRTRGGDVTKLMDALKFLDDAHGVFRVVLAVFLIARIASFALIRMG